MNAVDPSTLAGRCVLIVEDRFLIASELETQIRAMGGAVAGLARDIDSARRILKEQEVDLALLDVNLDGTVVFPLAEQLAAAGTPFIFLTGYDDWVLPAEWRDHPRLSKPVSNRDLGETLARLGLDKR